MDNYAPWDIHIDELATPHDFIRAAVLAPSSHNSQPWSFRINAENQIEVSLEKERELPASDTNSRQSIISLGCAIENVALVADYQGFDSVVTYGENPLATISFTKRAEVVKASSDHLANYIEKRVTNRSPHQSRFLDEGTLKDIRALATNSLRIDIISDANLVKQLGGIAIEAGIAALDQSGFRLELSRYLKSNGTKSKIGMPGFGFGFPAPLSIAAPHLIKRINMERGARKQNDALFASTNGILVISTDTDSQKDWLTAGRTYEQIALLATRAGMSTAPWAVAVQIGEYYRDVQALLNLQGRLQFFCRIGFPTKETPHSPRLSAGAVTTNI